jgi:hypothetical protein
MLLQFSETSPSIEIRDGNENTSDASRASKLSAIIPGDLSLACFVDPILSIQLLDDDTIVVPAEIYDAIPQLMTEAPEKRRRLVLFGDGDGPLQPTNHRMERLERK